MDEILLSNPSFLSPCRMYHVSAYYLAKIFAVQTTAHGHHGVLTEYFFLAGEGSSPEVNGKGKGAQFPYPPPSTGKCFFFGKSRSLLPPRQRPNNLNLQGETQVVPGLNGNPSNSLGWWGGSKFLVGSPATWGGGPPGLHRKARFGGAGRWKNSSGADGTEKGDGV